MELKELVRELFDIFDIVEASDNGTEFHPNTINSCRVMDMERISKLIKEIKEHI